ncbi:MAG: HAMP domain-containing protein, partial [Magnetococcales bacterium]|nr:HAMP domain-containing protein [Magnetococcales bacterium]
MSLNTFIVRKQTGQLKILAHTVARLSEHDFSMRSGIRGRDEIGLLGQTFDHMAARIQAFIQDLNREVREHQRTARDLAQTNEELRNFTYIVSHDLRSPMLSIQGFTEELQMDLGELEALLADAFPHLEPDRR